MKTVKWLIAVAETVARTSDWTTLIWGEYE